MTKGEMKESNSSSSPLLPALSSEEMAEHKRGKLRVITLAVCFMLLFSAFNSAQNLVGSIYSSQGFTNLGLVSLLTLYFVFAGSSLFANYFISRLPDKLIFVVSSLGYVSYSASGILVCGCKDSESSACGEGVIYAVVLAGAALCGFSASLIWITQGGYIDAIAQKTPSKKGEYSGTFWAIMQASQIIGSLAGTFILHYLSNMAYFLIMTGLGLFASFLFSFLPNVRTKNIEEADKQPPMTEQVKKVFVLMLEKRTRYFLPFMMLSGIIVSFYSGFLSKLVANSIDADTETDDGSSEVSKKLSFTLICLGIFEVISGLISGRLADKFNIYKLASVGTLLCLLGILLSFLGLFTQQYLICFFISATWGFSDCFFQTIIQTIANKDFPGEVQIFQVLRFTLSVTCSIFFIINLLLKNAPPYVYLMIVMVATALTNFAVTQLITQKKLNDAGEENKQKYKEVEEE